MKKLTVASIAAFVLVLAGLLIAPRVRAAWAVSRAKVASQANDCNAVLAALDGVTSAGSDQQFVHEVRAYCFIKSRHWQHARVEATAALALVPNSQQALTYRYKAASELGETAEAEEDLGRLLTLDPKNLVWLEARAELRAARGAWEAAIEDATAVLEKEPASPDALSIRAHAWHALGNWEKAYADVVAELALKRTTALLRDAADLAIPLRKLDEADAHVAAALAEAPDDPALAVLACRVRVAHTEQPGAGAAETDAALRECERTVRAVPKDAATHRRFGRMLKKKGDLDLALAQADAALAVAPSSSLAQELKADVLLAQKKPELALAAVDAALAAVGTDPEVNAGPAEASLRETRGDVLVALKRPDEARVDFEKSLALMAEDDPDAATVKQKVAQLPAKH